MALTAEQKSELGRAAAMKRWANHVPTPPDPKPIPLVLLNFLAKLEAEVDPAGAMAPQERRKAAVGLCRAHMANVVYYASRGCAETDVRPNGGFLAACASDGQAGGSDPDMEAIAYAE
ncbi:MAG TPA: hypothetical protein VGE93_17530 [Bryobacteraceae bacterium]